MGIFFLKKALHGGTKSFGKIKGGGGGGGYFTWGLLIRSCSEGGEASQMYFPII